MKYQEIVHNNHRWININEPDKEMVGFLNENFNFHPLAIEDVLSKFQFPKIDSYKDYLFIILQFPIFLSGKNLYKRSEVDIFLGDDYLITINSGELQPLKNLFELCSKDEQARQKYMRSGPALLFYEITDLLFDNVFPIVNNKFEVVFSLEDDVFNTKETRDVVQEIMILKRDIINLKRIISPQKALLSDLEIKYKKFIPRELDIYFDDIGDKIDKINNQLDTAASYTDVLEDANETIISRNTNKVIKILTIFSVIMLPLTLVTSYYGMNINLPLQQSPQALSFVNGLMIVLLVGMIAFFSSKKWFS